MNTKSFIILIVILVVGAGAYFYSGAKQSINASDNIGAPILEGMQESLNNVTQMQVVGAGNKVLATIIRANDSRAVKQRNSYPADLSKVRAALLNLAEAKIVEEKTSNPDLYTKLGVEDVSAAEAIGVQAIVEYDDQSVGLIVGKPGPQMNKSRYVRLADSKTSWLIDRKIDLKYQAEHWLRKDILSVEPNEVSNITVTMQNDGEVLAIASSEEQEGEFIVTNLPNESAQVVGAELHQVANALSSFQLLDVANAGEFKDLSPVINVDYQLKSGAKISLVGYDKEDAHFASVEASLVDGVEDKTSAQAYVDKINNITSGWVYKIPNVTYDSMNKRVSDVLAITEDQLN